MICKSIYPHLEKNFKIYSAIPWNFCHPHSFWNFYERKKNLGTVNIGNNGLWFNSSQETQPLQTETTKILNKKHSTREEKKHILSIGNLQI